MINAVFISGIGGTGKTSILDQLKSERDDLYYVYSPTRKVYLKEGVKDERSFKDLSPDEQIVFQGKVFDAYVNQVSELYQDHHGHDNFVFDRSPFDYVSYQIATLPNLTLEQIEVLIFRALKVMSLFTKCFIVTLPYPTPWGAIAEDDMRLTNAGKNYAWNCILQHLLTTHMDSVLYPVGATDVIGRARTVTQIIDNYCKK